MGTTTIRVPRNLHDRLAKRAAEQGTTLAGAIDRALSVEDRVEFWARVEQTMGTPEARVAIRVDSEAFAGSLKDGLDPAERWDDVL